MHDQILLLVADYVEQVECAAITVCLHDDVAQIVLVISCVKVVVDLSLHLQGWARLHLYLSARAVNPWPVSDLLIL